MTNLEQGKSLSCSDYLLQTTHAEVDLEMEIKDILAFTKDSQFLIASINPVSNGWFIAFT